MKLQFEPNLDFQIQAINAVCDLFRGQEIGRTEFTVSKCSFGRQSPLPFREADRGVGNRLTLLDDQILANLKDVQLRNGLRAAESLTSGNFTVEMETGTGKTYVYLRTIFELNRRYGFTKFAIVVPSIAIKEGVYKSLQIMDDHFRVLYSGTPFEYFLYDSRRTGLVRNFATSGGLQIMIVTVGAINKRDVNNLYKDNERTGGEKPIDLIRATHPIHIVDEPQSVDGGLGGQGKAALEAMNPLCTLRYSATHFDQYHQVYKLDAVDAFERKLVKQIEVASATLENAHNAPYVRLISTKRKGGEVNAIVELDVEDNGKVRRRRRVVYDGDDLEQETGRALYRNHRVGEIRTARASGSMELRLPQGQRYLNEGECWGDVDNATIHRQMIRRTIREHLDKELRLHPQGVKVLSLFFIDAVGRYRRYDESGKPIKGEYARMFEDEYQRLAAHPDYASLFEDVELARVAAHVHDGYFSIDRKGGWTDTAENNQVNRESAERAYSLIMKEKERLLSLHEPLRFIFSHSALREGWDNPNVFQICALREIQTERERRQTIGRGLRLCVNQRGERVRGTEVNTLTVVAREAYEDFAENLQKEIEQDTGVRFGVIDAHDFSQISVKDDTGKDTTLGLRNSEVLYDHLRTNGYIDENGRVQDVLRQALSKDAVEVPGQFAAEREAILSVLRRRAGRLNVKNADEREIVRPRRAVLDSEDFRRLWERIRYKTTYRVAFDNEALLEQCAIALRDAPKIPRTRLQWRKADIAIGQAGVEATEVVGSATVVLEESEVELPDLLTELEGRTELTRRSIQRIVVGSGRLSDFARNPQKFIEVATEVINSHKNQMLVGGIRYRRIGESAYYAQELLEQGELTGYLRSMLVSQKSIYDNVIFESDTEAHFASSLEKNTDVKLYAKLPGWFTVATPLGEYNPDWAVLLESDKGERLYFVVETKGSSEVEDLRLKEYAKIQCGKAHFAALEARQNPARYIVASGMEELVEQMAAG
ncbi:MAG: DEAD/DEAH box helicase family protein [Chloroflexota bacterium]|nr:DEAD/DEAH box helicase family protein [Chloroflexota bacterium]